MRSLFVTAATAALALLAAAPASAAVLGEDFNETPFHLWESNWFGTESNAVNYYVAYMGSSHDDRGNNPDGLWVADGTGSAKPLTILFKSAFAAGLKSLDLDLASYVDMDLTIFDRSGATLLFTHVTNTFGAYSFPGAYAHYSATSANGIGGFSLSGNAQGNVSIDNLNVTHLATGVPEPSTWALMLLGFGAAGSALRRRPARVIGC